MDAALSVDEQSAVRGVLAKYEQDGIQFHAMRTRQAGARRFVSIHVLVPGNWTVQRGHQMLERLEADVRQALSNVTVFTHLEPLGDVESWQDMALDRPDSTLNESAGNQNTEAPQ